MFNPDLLIDLVKKAQGEHSLNQFAKLCGIDSGNLSRIINNKNTRPPKPDTLKKIADQAQNGITYEALMQAAGHIIFSGTAEDKNTSVLTAKDERDIEKRIQLISEDLKNNPDGLMLSGTPVSPEAIESIIEALSYGIRQAKIVNKKYTPKKYRK